MKFVLNFIFFGILFYVISLYFPEQFQLLQSWAASAVDMMKQVYQLILQKLNLSGSPAPAPDENFWNHIY